jgi:hypothetical protein
MKLPTDPRAWLPLLGYAAGAVAVIAALWWAVSALILAPREAAETKARGVVAEETTIATGAVGEAALEVTREVHTEYRRIDEITRSNEHEIRNASGADAPAGAVAGALRRGLCQHRAYRGDAGCAAVLGDAEGVGPAGGDDGRAAPR